MLLKQGMGTTDHLFPLGCYSLFHIRLLLLYDFFFFLSFEVWLSPLNLDEGSEFIVFKGLFLPHSSDIAPVVTVSWYLWFIFSFFWSRATPLNAMSVARSVRPFVGPSALTFLCFLSFQVILHFDFLSLSRDDSAQLRGVCLLYTSDAADE